MMDLTQVNESVELSVFNINFFIIHIMAAVVFVTEAAVEIFVARAIVAFLLHSFMLCSSILEPHFDLHKSNKEQTHKNKGPWIWFFMRIQLYYSMYINILQRTNDFISFHFEWILCAAFLCFGVCFVLCAFFNEKIDKSTLNDKYFG